MRRSWWIVAAIVVALGAGAAVWLLRPVTGPPRDLTLAADAERGAYMLRVAGCIPCHTDTKNDGALLAGGAPIRTAFGSFVPPNITPDPQAGIGNWTVAQFAAALSDGVGPQGHLYPAFPYDNYTLMSDGDVVDLFAALRQVPPVAESAPGHSVLFPFSIRLANLAWKNLFFTPARFAPDPARSARWNRGAYLANGPGHCSACHTPRNLFGARDDTHAFAGGRGPGGRAPALTPSALGRRGYDPAALVDTLESGFTPGFDVLGGGMGEVIAESTSRWTAEDREAVAAYLLDLD
jgi:mono/diheme cytochrome c family protein